MYTRDDPHLSLIRKRIVPSKISILKNEKQGGDILSDAPSLRTVRAPLVPRPPASKSTQTHSRSTLNSPSISGASLLSSSPCGIPVPPLNSLDAYIHILTNESVDIGNPAILHTVCIREKRKIRNCSEPGRQLRMSLNVINFMVSKLPLITVGNKSVYHDALFML